MFHSIITIVTTAAVALHAMLGCCAHHDHSCQSHESGPIEVVNQADDHCSHGHHHHGHHQHHSDEGAPSEADNDSGDQHDRDQRHGCDEEDCSFTSVLRSNDLELILTFSMWCQALGDTAQADAIANVLLLRSVAESPPDLSAISSSVRATTQVWRL